MRRKYFIFYIFLFGALFSCSSGDDHEGNEIEYDQSTSVSNSVGVEVVIAKALFLNKIITASGKINSEKDINVISQSAGRVKKIMAKNGLIYTQGSSLIAFESKELDYRIQRAELLLYNAEKEYESLMLGYKTSLQTLTTEEMINVKKKFAISSGFELNKVELAALKNERQKLNLRAPIHGKISDLKVSENSMVTNGQFLFRIYDPFNFSISIKVIERDLTSLSLGSKARIKTISSSSMYSGTLIEINPYVDENGMVEVRFRLDNVKGTQPFPGTSCIVEIEKKATSRAILVPKTAIVMHREGPVVFKLENGKAIWNYVTTGEENKDVIQIISGLKVGDTVITSNNLELSHNSFVHIK